MNRAEESQTVKEKDAVDGPDNTQQPANGIQSAITTQVFAASFVRPQPVVFPSRNGAFPAVQSASQTEQAQRRRSIRSLAAGSLRRTNIGNAGKAGDAGSAGSTKTDGREEWRYAVAANRQQCSPLCELTSGLIRTANVTNRVGILDIHAVHARYARFATLYVAVLRHSN